ncbi:WecB/TagA/CpsF family glycosyltransferase [Nitrospira sp. M1]
MNDQVIPRVNVLGVGVSAINMTQAIDTFDQWIRNRERHYVCITGVHGVMESQQDSRLRDIHNQAGLVTPDGMPLVWISRWQGYSNVHRVYGPDLLLRVCQHSVLNGYRHFFYGGADGVAQTLADRLVSRFPGLKVVGAYSPPFRELTSQEDEEILYMINEKQPHFVWVGMSTPKQERWMAAHQGKLSAAAMIGVGAAFDFHAGLKKQAPHWMQRSGLEWFFRLLTEPRRLWKRYLTNNPKFLYAMCLQTLKIRQYE